MYYSQGSLAAAAAQRRDASYMAIEKANNESRLPGYHFKLSPADTFKAPLPGLSAVLDLIQKSPSRLYGIVGAASSSVSKVTTLASAIYGIPQISYSSTDPELSNKNTYPNFFRVVTPDSVQGVAVANLVAHYGWKRVALMHTNDAYGTGGAQIFQSAASTLDIDVATVQDFSPDSQDVTAQLDAIEASGVRIVVIFMLTGDARTVLQAAHARGLVSPTRAWVGTDGSMQPALFKDLPVAVTEGLIGTTPRSARLAGTDFFKLWQAKGYPVPVNLFAPYAYDATQSFIEAIVDLAKTKYGGNPNQITAGELQARLITSDFAGDFSSPSPAFCWGYSFYILRLLHRLTPTPSPQV
jgi:ABC-type branched-subunit amino acid transport system substrate-binding protein